MACVMALHTRLSLKPSGLTCVSGQEDPNARVEYVRDHFSEHLTLDPIGAPRALLWLRDRFAGKPVASGVGTTDVGSMMLDPATWQVCGDTVGTTLAAAFQQPIGSGR